MSNEKQRLLTNWEIANLLSRHPIIAEYVAATKAALLTVGYDYLNDAGIIGVIPQSGYSLDDDNYGTVVIQPAPNGEIYFSGWTTVRPNIVNLPPYTSPRDPNAPSDCDWLCQMGQHIDTATMLLTGFVIIYAYKAIKK